MIRQVFGSISFLKRDDSYQVYFSNPLINKPKYIGCYKKKEDAEKVLNEHIYNFYSENTYLLPKGIWVQKAQKSFVYGITINGKNKHLFISKSLKEVYDYRIKFITSLI